jgi:hypothetical protein
MEGITTSGPKILSRSLNPKNKKSPNLNDLRIFLPTEVVRTGIEPVFHP